MFPVPVLKAVSSIVRAPSLAVREFVALGARLGARPSTPSALATYAVRTISWLPEAEK